MLEKIILGKKKMSQWENRESIVLKNNGEKIFGIVHRPMTSSRYPVVMVCHGLGGHKTGRYRVYVHLAEMLTKIGIACIRFDFRGSGDSEGDFTKMTIDSEVSDAMTVLDYLQKDGGFDSNRIGIFGRSFGGVIAINVAKKYGNVKSMALWAPLYNGDQWREKWAQMKAHKLSEEICDKLMRINGLLPGTAFYEQLFELKIEPELTSLNDVPLLHIHGELDEIVNLSHADRYVAFRKNAKGSTRFLRFGKCDHDFSDPQEQQMALNETAIWFQNTLL